MNSRRILVLGYSQSSQWFDSYSWSYIPEQLNVADYDVVILNFKPFEIQAVAQSVDIDRIPRFPQFARLLFSEGAEIVVIGRPFFRLGTGPYLISTWWLPITPTFLDESGETVQLRDEDFAFYFDHVRHWSFCLAEWKPRHQDFFAEYMVAAGIRWASRLIPHLYWIAENRYPRPIGFAVKFVAESHLGDRLRESGHVIWLPPTTEISEFEAIDLLLRERYGVLREETAPHWVEQYSLPDEMPVRNRIEELESNIAKLDEELKQTWEELEIVTRFKKLLYETGEDILEPVVLDTLRELGADIELPKDKGKEDGRLTDPSGRIATLEIKGRAGTLRVSDVRQAHQWVADSIAYEGRESKGILIANLNRDQPPAKRCKVFPSNCTKVARNFDISLVTTTQIFHALALHQQGQLDTSHFWDSVFQAKGICEFPELK
jgi:hypothetical protein